MLEGWYCRTMANQQATTSANDEPSDDSQEPQQPTSNARNMEHNGVDYKSRYLLLKRKLKFLIYENEYFQDTLRFNQRRLLKISKDRAFLLDRLLQYEKPGSTSSEGEATESSDDDTTTPKQPQPPKETVRRRKMEGRPAPPGGATRGRKRKIPLNQGTSVQPPLQKQKRLQQLTIQQRPLVTTTTVPATATSVVEQDKREMQLTTAEITRQLQARKPSAIELMSVECTSATVPATMLSDESPSKCFQTDQPQHYLDGSSPSHVAAEECVAMEYIN